jgi:isopentenyl phosphate kinase
MHSKSQKKPPPTSSGGHDARRPSHAAARPSHAEIRLLRAGMVEWREDLRRCLLQAGVKDTPTSFVFTDAQVVMESFLEDVNNILNAGDVPNLYGARGAS